MGHNFIKENVNKVKAILKQTVIRWKSGVTKYRKIILDSCCGLDAIGRSERCLRDSEQRNCTEHAWHSLCYLNLILTL